MREMRRVRRERERESEREHAREGDERLREKERNESDTNRYGAGGFGAEVIRLLVNLVLD